MQPHARASIKLESGFCGGGLQTTVSPAAIAGAIAHAMNSSGKLNGVIAAITSPDGRCAAATGRTARARAGIEQGRHRVDAIEQTRSAAFRFHASARVARSRPPSRRRSPLSRSSAARSAAGTCRHPGSAARAASTARVDVARPAVDHGVDRSPELPDWRPYGSGPPVAGPRRRR